MKRWLYIAGSAALLGLLLWQGEVTTEGVRSGLMLCGRSVIPALFPFMLAVRLLTALGLGQCFSPKAAALTIGAMGGYPLGAATVGQLYEAGQLSRREAAGLLCCCNNAGPAFILTFLGQGVFGSQRAGLLLWGIHLISALFAALLFFPRQRSAAPACAMPCSFSSALVTAVTQSVDTILRVCGFVVLFSVVTAVFAHFGMTSPLVLGALELTCGAGALPHTARGFVMAAALLGWGGVSVHCQTAAVLQGSGLPLGRYVACKALQGAVSGALAWVVAAVCF